MDSIARSTMNVHMALDGRVGTKEVEGWEHMNEVDEVNANISLTKTMSWMKLTRQTISTFIAKDLLGGDADTVVTNSKRQQAVVLNLDRMRVNEVSG